MKKNTLVLLLLFCLGSCCTKEDTCLCPTLDMELRFECYTDKEVGNFEIIRYDSTTFNIVSNENMNLKKNSNATAFYNISLENDTKYIIEIVNKPLGISRVFSRIKYWVYDFPFECSDCKTRFRYKSCNRVEGMNYLVNGKPIDKKKNGEPTLFETTNLKNCFPGYRPQQTNP
jgi:hypothetical protein